MQGQLTCTIVYYSGTCLKRPPLGPKLLTALDRWSYYAVSTECKRSFRTTGSGHNREVVAQTLIFRKTHYSLVHKE